MSLLDQDTIAAIATPPGRGGVGIVRLSGPDALSIAETITQQILKPRYASFTQFFNDDKTRIDEGIGIYFKSPNSFTGEDVVELQGHGGPVVMNLLLKRTIQLGARLANPGEFSERAFLNDKIDLVQAEAIADLIDASSEQAARSAVRSLQGEFSQQVKHILQRLIEFRMYVEAALDFPEEEIDFLKDEKVEQSLRELIEQTKAVTEKAKQGALLQQGMTLVIAGKPNAGKSSLLNCLAGQESAIVTDIAGTTRDTLKETIQIDGLPIHVIDTAGLRESSDVVEQEGVKRAKSAIEQADLVLWIHDVSDSCSEETAAHHIPEGRALIHVKNKIDLLQQSPRIETQANETHVFVSIKESLGIDLLKKHIKSLVGYQQTGEDTFIARGRHLEALQKVTQTLEKAHEHLRDHQAGELLAEDLLLAQNTLNSITGEFGSDDLLGVIFSSFCIGK